MSLDNALQASNEWHEELANQTTGNKFTKIKKQNGKIVDPNVVLVFDENLINSLGLSTGEKIISDIIILPTYFF
jgi:hypothetical protein